ncbi:OsmC family protein [Rapidithrix thailandica]|uniref:OsmC family protein n=1 Tax=Rapidithrix thailandica TaxID=413964 RepID=A0AAW9S782_9BACT
MMKIEINRESAPVHFVASNEDGNTISIDGSEAIGGAGKGMRPMQVVLGALGTCSCFDIVEILKKQRQDLQDIKITVTAERADAVPAPFTAIHLHFRLWGELDENKVSRAIDLGVNKYCSVGVILEKSAKITYTFEINP